MTRVSAVKQGRVPHFCIVVCGHPGGSLERCVISSTVVGEGTESLNPRAFEFD
jgi:hypothetical protein